MRVCEERCYLSGESRNESEIDSPSNGEETDEMPALTDSDMSEIEEEEDGEISESESEVKGRNNLKHQAFKSRGSNKKILKKRKTRVIPESMSESSDDCPETASDQTTEDDYSDEDHVYLI